MKTIDQWLQLYARDHQHPANKLIHWICVPVIFFTVLGLLWCIPLRLEAKPWINAATVFYVLALAFYFRLSIPLFIGFMLVGGAMLLIHALLYEQIGAQMYLYIQLGLFVIAWIFQFIGHKLEGQKPAFFEDLQFLLIGPAWILHFIYKKIGIDYK